MGYWQDQWIQSASVHWLPPLCKMNSLVYSSVIWDFMTLRYSMSLQMVLLAEL